MLRISYHARHVRGAAQGAARADPPRRDAGPAERDVDRGSCGSRSPHAHRRPRGALGSRVRDQAGLDSGRYALGYGLCAPVCGHAATRAAAVGPGHDPHALCSKTIGITPE